MRVLLAVAALVFASPAQATWYQASSRHFLIYSEQRPSTLRAFAEKLERFDQAVRRIRAMQELPPSKGNRLVVFVLPNAKEVRRLANDQWISGFYKARGAGSVAFVPRRLEDDPEGDISSILLHEYSHHLMFQDLSAPYPEWLVEGFAEFMAASKFERDGSVGIGLPDTQRAYGLLNERGLPLEALLGVRYAKITDVQRESIYGRGWLMTHYFTFEPSRRKQLQAYIRGMAAGMDPLDSAKAAFGDLKKLDRDLESYLRQSRMHYLHIPGTLLNPGPIEISTVAPGAAAAMMTIAELKNDPDAKAAAGIAARLRTVEAQFPADALVEAALAEAELAAGNPAAAEAAADRALRADPGSADAMLLKGRAATENLARGGTATEAQFEQARSWFLKANKIDPEDPEPLYEFYHSFVQARQQPTSNAIDALHYASDLAPQDLGLRITSAGLYVFAGKLDKARAALLPVAYDPHGGDAAAMARRVIERIDAGDNNGALAAAGWRVIPAKTH